MCRSLNSVPVWAWASNGSSVTSESGLSYYQFINVYKLHYLHSWLSTQRPLECVISGWHAHVDSSGPCLATCQRCWTVLILVCFSNSLYSFEWEEICEISSSWVSITVMWLSPWCLEAFEMSKMQHKMLGVNLLNSLTASSSAELGIIYKQQTVPSYCNIICIRSLLS